MAKTKSRLDNLPKDVLKQVMLHLARAPNGEVSIMRSFYVCKSIHQEISKDEEILRVVAFQDMSKYCCQLQSVEWDERGNPNLGSQFQAFQAIGGFIYRAAKAGNLRAELILAKLIIMSTSELFCAQNEVSNSAQNYEGEDKNKLRRQARTFMAHFTYDSTQNDSNSSTRKLVHYELVRKLLYQGSVEPELIQTMKTYLQNYASYFFNPSVRRERYENFLLMLNEFDKLQPVNKSHMSFQLYVNDFNRLCIAAKRNLRKLGVKSFPNVRELKLPRLPTVEDKDYHDFNQHNLVQRYRLVHDLITKGIDEARRLASDSGNADDLRSITIARLLDKRNKVWCHLCEHMKFMMTVWNVQKGIVFNFNAMFPKSVGFSSLLNS